MNETNNPLAWVEKAEEDFALTRSALQRRKPLLTGACFHAQQCSEKYMKALLVSKGAEFPKTHDLLILNDLCSKVSRSRKRQARLMLDDFRRAPQAFNGTTEQERQTAQRQPETFWQL